MRTFYKLISFAVILLTGFTGTKAQSPEKKLDQVELMKKFAGRWKCEVGKDTIMIAEVTVFGSGLVSKGQVIVNGKVVNSSRQLYGYDKKQDKFIVAELIESSQVIEICSSWFTSENTGKLIITNPDNISLTFEFVFRTPDLIVQTAFQGNKAVREITLHKIQTGKR